MKKALTMVCGAAIFVGSLAIQRAQAALFPSLTLSSTGSSVQIIVSNADANAPVTFKYPSGSINIGTTNSSGYLTVTLNPGQYNISTGNPVYVIVDGEQSSSATWPTTSSASSGVTLYLTQTSATLNIGQNISINASNVVGNLSIPGNTNPTVASASLNGNIVNISGLANGTAAITICADQSGCATVNVTVQPSYLTSAAIYLSPSNVTLNVGQTQNVAITGYVSGPYYVSSNSGTSYVSAAISNSTLILTGLSAGGANISVCATGGQCGSMYASVAGGGNSSSPSTVLQTGNPALTSLTVSSNDANGTFMTTGTQFTFSFMTNQPAVNPQVSVGQTQVLVNGTGNGPYTASYTVTGAEAQPLPVVVTFTNSSGTLARTYFWLGNAPASIGSAAVAVAAPTPSPTPVPAVTTSGSSQTAAVASAPVGSHAFSRYLYIGMTPLGVADPDVTALQQRLTSDGLYSGPITGYFGNQTRAAVILYQEKHGLSPLGVVGPSTRALLNQGV
ncbi:MAG: peptidoglycan-binding protein [Patescibacteria group bacterium]|nr:peptidoglycan-binding protein [Patescibacteria group bacterium]MDE2172666.1 peptidoglycan-binding protein [Patescibacteria group bacterium]